MRFKDNVTVTFTTTNKVIMSAFEKACKEVLGPGYEPEVTSGLEGDHSLESGHYHGRSLDFKSSDIYYTNHDAILKKVKTILGDDYFVQLEDSPAHFHIQRNKNTF